MLVCLIIALFATFTWISVNIAEIANPSSDGVKRARVKNYLAMIMALFWGIVIRYFNG